LLQSVQQMAVKRGNVQEVNPLIFLAYCNFIA